MVVGAMVYIVLNFVARGVLSLIETLGTPLFHQYNHLQPIVTRRKHNTHTDHHALNTQSLR
jgi:predicted permease